MSDLPPTSRRDLRAAATAEAAVIADTTDVADGAAPTRRRRLGWWIFGVIVLLLAAVGGAGAFVASKILPDAESAKASLEAAVPLASQIQTSLVAGDTEAATAAANEMKRLTAQAREDTTGQLWTSLEWVPVAGANLSAVREVAETVDDFVERAIIPVAGISVESLAPSGGRIDVDAVRSLSATVDTVAGAVADAQGRLAAIDQTPLVGQVTDGIARFDGAISQVAPLIDQAQDVLSILPGMLGGDGARNYLVLVQNNAESRGTGGNPAAIIMVTVDNGAVSISQQASSMDFPNGRSYPVTELDPETVALYGDKVGRYIQDVTTTPDFTESARIAGAFWAETFGTQIDATVSIDPVALSYMLGAAGPITLPDGEVLTGENVVPVLLNDVYFRFDGSDVGELTDEFFAVAAGAIFEALTAVSNPRAMVDAVARAVDEGRILYVTRSEAEAALLGDARITGILPRDNTEITMLGSYINDITEGKLNYYMDTAIDLSSTVCEVAASEAPSFVMTTTLTSTLQPDDVDDLARYISPGRFFPKGDISTDLVVYGPVGASVVAASIDGVPLSVSPLTHLGRPAVKINVINEPATTRQVTVQFAGVAGESYGPLAAWHTPMVRETPVVITTPGCPTAP